MEVIYDQPTGRCVLVFELMDCNLYQMIQGQKSGEIEDGLTEKGVKNLMY